jgi:hypothetical protein
MTSAPVPYDDASTPAEMTADCEAAWLALRLPSQATPTGRTSAPGLAAGIRVPAAAAALAGRFAE